MKPTVLYLALALLVSGPAAAQSAPPESLNYQGVLRDATDAPLDGSHDMIFRFFDAASGGNELLVDSHLASGTGAVAVANGLFNVEVGGGAVAAGSGTGAVSSLRALFHGHSTVYMEVQVSTEVLSPRTRVLSSAYALNALDETDVDAFVANNGYALQSNLATIATTGSFSDLSGVPADLADGDDDVVGDLSCADGQAPAWDGGQWNCVDFVPDVSEDLVYNSGWLSFPFRQTLTINVGSPFEFALGIVRSWDEYSGEVVTPIMAANYSPYAPAYVGLDEIGGTFSLYGQDYVGLINNLGDRNGIAIRSGNVRYTAFDRMPDWTSGWFSCGSNSTYNYSHGLGTVPQLALVEVAQNFGGSGWRVPMLSSSNYNGGNWAQTAIVSLNASSVAVRTGTFLANVRQSSSVTVSPTNGYCNVKLFIWAPDYDSGWQPITTALGSRDLYLEHGLDGIPSMFMLYVAQNPDGSGWFLPAMGGFHQNYTTGVGLYDLTERWVTIKGGASYVAHFIDAAGSNTYPSSGYVRFVAWK